MSTNGPETLIDEATHWLVRIHSGLASQAEQQAFREWRSADPQHEALCARLEQTLGLFQAPIAQGVCGERLGRLLNAPSSRRRMLQQSLALSGLVLGAGWLGSRSGALDGFVADLRTGTAERRTVELDDGSRVTLNARSTLDVRYASKQRRLRLYDGEIMVQVAPGHQRPFVVETAFGQVVALGNDLQLRHGEDSHAVALNGALSIRTYNGAELILPAGQQVNFDLQGFGRLSPNLGSESAWINGLLEVHNRPLADVIEAMRAYRRGIVRLDPAIADWRVSGLYRLDDSELMLEALARTLPLRVTRITDLWINLEAA